MLLEFFSKKPKKSRVSMLWDTEPPPSVPNPYSNGQHIESPLESKPLSSDQTKEDGVVISNAENEEKTPL